MSRNMLIAVAAALVVGGLIFALNRPEPTPEARLEEALKETGESAREAADALKDAVTEATESTARDMEKAAADARETMTRTIESMTEEIAASAEQTRDRLQTFVSEWKSSGIITEKGLDFDKAIQAVDESEMSDESKARVKNILSALRDAPGAFADKFARLEAELSN